MNNGHGTHPCKDSPEQFCPQLEQLHHIHDSNAGSNASWVAVAKRLVCHQLQQKIPPNYALLNLLLFPASAKWSGKWSSLLLGDVVTARVSVEKTI
jgi:hypothetical protein